MGRSGRSPEAGAPAPDRREQSAAESGRLADERERLADERGHEADEREHEADERERLADEREHEADKRERLADQREKRLDELAREVALLVTDRHTRAELARAYEELTTRDPPQASEHRGSAGAARKAARQVGEIGRQFSS